MTNRLKFGVGLTSTFLLLAACGDNMDAEDISQASDELYTSYEEIIAINNQLNEKEQALDEQFVELLNQDETLGTIQDESASVVQNLNERSTIVGDLEEHETTIREQAEYLGTYEGTDLPAETIQEVSNEFLAFADEIASYQTTYQESLTVQSDYFNQISADDANYEDFMEGIKQVNENYTELQEATVILDNHFTEINAQFTEIDKLMPDETAETEQAEEEIEEQVEEADSDEAATEVAGAEDTEDETDDETADENSDNENAEEEAPVEEPEPEVETQFLTVNTDPLLNYPDKFPQKFVYDSGVDIEYPAEGVKGIYTTAHSAGGDRMDYLVDLINSTELNAMVIDIKDDYGNITLDLNSDNELVNEMTNELVDAEELMTTLEENDIYPIARIVVFKDSHLAESHPEWSFTQSDGSVWSNNRGESFVNPYMEEVWDYNIEVAVQAAKLGFKDIQFDYVRFPEGFETRADTLNYSHGNYASDSEDVINMEYRNRAITEFTRKAKESLMPYGADLSVDIFGYAAVVRETPGIGQSFPGISREVDVISSMIYPSHWGPGNLGIDKPDLEPYNVVNNYMPIEQEILDELGDEAPISRPWIQDFTASYLGAGNYISYGAPEVTAQIKALADNGVHEYLLWNAGNSYSENATFDFQ